MGKWCLFPPVPTRRHPQFRAETGDLKGACPQITERIRDKTWARAEGSPPSEAGAGMLVPPETEEQTAGLPMGLVLPSGPKQITLS